MLEHGHPQTPASPLHLANTVAALIPHTPTHTAERSEHDSDMRVTESFTQQTNTTPVRLPDHRSTLTWPSPSPASPARVPLPDTPSARTGPPRSLSFHFTPTQSPVVSHRIEPSTDLESVDIFGDEATASLSRSPNSRFRGPFEQRTLDLGGKNKGKQREHRSVDDSWGFTRLFQEPLTEDDARNDAITSEPRDKDSSVTRRQTVARSATGNLSNPLKRSRTHPVPGSSAPQENGHSRGTTRWAKLRVLLPSVIRHVPSPQSRSPVASHEVNVTNDLMYSGLCPLILGMSFERDERGQRRIPLLLHLLRLRITDSFLPLHSRKALFRIECEYADSAVRWVVYRQLRDFVRLHARYTVFNAVYGNKNSLPEFPRTSLPYLNFLKKESGTGQVRHADFTRLQRQGLEDYLISLIRAVMFHPSANRLLGFLEISALFIALAPIDGPQYKAGFLRIKSSGAGPGVGRRSAGRHERSAQRWCAIRDSYLVIVEEPAETVIWDVILLDSEFEVQRPHRPYRKGLNLLRPALEDEESSTVHHADGEVSTTPAREVVRVSAMDSCVRQLSRLFRIGHRPALEGISSTQEGQPCVTSPSPRRQESFSSEGSHSVLSPIPVGDSSTNPNLSAAGVDDKEKQGDQNRKSEKRKKNKRSDDMSRHTLKVKNSQMKLELLAHSKRQMLQWHTALEKVAKLSPYATRHRYGSFAPIRGAVAAQWLVDGRDYMWNLSRALVMARETIYIHDWWLSPELLLRRPDKQKYRLDKLLESKANEGVKIYIIIYREVSSKTTPTDSNYAKTRLMSLHPHNIMVQRSPSHFQTRTFYWAHHEKLCVIDQTIAFMGGIDLCFGRWDTPQHVLVDDPELNTNGTEIWPGKDYSNPRVVDFHTLHRPDESMYDRAKVPRMPWHDVGMQVVGQPARDLARHFVERWNYLLRIKNHTKPMPFLLPPSEFKEHDLASMGLTGTCEMQICRSAGPWSLGTLGRVERSIENAYVEAIRDSEHFVYIENQFFITSTTVNDVKIQNRIGDALVERIIRAHQERTPWRCCILIPLLPGFPFPLGHSDASAVRIILECQNRSLFRGPDSIYWRLRRQRINAEDYMSVFSLRNWGKLRNDLLTTEIVYIHAKVCIVDDRVAIIGSANINERSQRGGRDSEIAAVIHDTDMIDSSMAGRPYKVGRFAHTLRVRLMQEHVGVDVDTLSALDHDLVHQTESVHQTRDAGADQSAHTSNVMQTKDESGLGRSSGESEATGHAGVTCSGEAVGGTRGKDPCTVTMAVSVADTHCQPSTQQTKASSTLDVPGRRRTKSPDANVRIEEPIRAPSQAAERTSMDSDPLCSSTGTCEMGKEMDVRRQRSSSQKRHLGELKSRTWTLSTSTPRVDPNDFDDPISGNFWNNVWVACAQHNTDIYRDVFRAVPDDHVSTWKQYTEVVAYHERFTRLPRERSAAISVSQAASGTCDDLSVLGSDVTQEKQGGKEAVHVKEGDNKSDKSPPLNSNTLEKIPRKVKSRPGIEPFDREELEVMEELLSKTRGHLVIYPAHFLEAEDEADNFLFNSDKMLPLQIYT